MHRKCADYVITVSASVHQEISMINYRIIATDSANTCNCTKPDRNELLAM